MKYLKLFESLDNIHEICEKYKIKNYTINSDRSIDVDGNVDLHFHNFVNGYRKLTKLPIKFRNVYGSFYCYNNNLTSLEGSPIHVGGHFNCRDNRLTSLESAPNSVGGIFNCSINNLMSLKGAPISVGGDFYCNNNNLNNLEGAPNSICGYFNCSINNLTSLEGAPTHISSNFYCSHNPVFEIWKLFSDKSKIELFNDYDIIRGKDIVLDRLNDFLITIGKDPVKSVKGYNNI